MKTIPLLALSLVGHKQQEGDRRTPEGRHMPDYRNPKSTFVKSIHISYPNAGGNIMIHGQANDPVLRAAIDRHPPPDWTWGCISMKDEDMQRPWDTLPIPTPIHIHP